VESPTTPTYGATRDRQPNVSYGDVEGAAFEILSQGRRPAVETIRQQLGRGSPATIASCLKRFWQTFAARAQGDPAALTRMPSEIAELADGLWQRALALANQSAKQDDNAARERLAQIQMENEIRAQSFALRERELDAQARARETTLADSRDHLLLLIQSLAHEQQTVRAQESRIANLNTQLRQSQKQLATLIAAAVVRNRAIRTPPTAPPRERKTATATRMRTKARSDMAANAPRGGSTLANPPRAKRPFKTQRKAHG